MRAGNKIKVQKETAYAVTDVEVKEYTTQLQEDLRKVQEELSEESTSPVHVVEPPMKIGDVGKVMEETNGEAEGREGTVDLHEGC